jgi:hypothetical protein
VLRPKALPFEPVPGGSFLNRLLWRELLETIKRFSSGQTVLGIGKPSQLALTAMRKFQFSTVIHDYMDDFPAFCEGMSRRHMERVERETMFRASKGIASSASLCARWKNGAALLVRNAFDAKSLPDISTVSDSGRHPVLGYVGTIDHWFDWEAVRGIALAFPTCTVRLIGPLLAPPMRSLPGNIDILPPCSMPGAMWAMQEFSVGIVPFKVNRLTASVDPIKYYEYRAMGLPVLSTEFGEMVYHASVDDGVFLFNMGNLKDVLGSALSYRTDSLQVLEFRDKNSWDIRLQALDALF